MTMAEGKTEAGAGAEESASRRILWLLGCTVAYLVSGVLYGLSIEYATALEGQEEEQKQQQQQQQHAGKGQGEGRGLLVNVVMTAVGAGVALAAHAVNQRIEMASSASSAMTTKDGAGGCGGGGGGGGKAGEVEGEKNGNSNVLPVTREANGKAATEGAHRSSFGTQTGGSVGEDVASKNSRLTAARLLPSWGHVAALVATYVVRTFTHVLSLHYVIYGVEVVARAWKPSAVLIFSRLLGRQYPMRSYVNLLVITLGVGLVMFGGQSFYDEAADSTAAQVGSSSSSSSSSSVIGPLLVALSVSASGLNGACQERAMRTRAHLDPFYILFVVQGFACVIFFLVYAYQIGPVTATSVLLSLPLRADFFVLVSVGLFDGLGYVVEYLTTKKFGALNCSLIINLQKLLSFFFSFIVFNHEIYIWQAVGVGVALLGSIDNLLQKQLPSKSGIAAPGAIHSQSDDSSATDPAIDSATTTSAAVAGDGGAAAGGQHGLPFWQSQQERIRAR